MQDREKIQKSLQGWYDANKRDLPWRDIGDPYLIWVSEVMLQQTRVETVIGYFQAWRKRFPDLKSLANAPEEEVLKIWEGMGYYQRARNLHKAASIVQNNLGGRIPEEASELKKLPGIGAYIAGAIASIAFGRQEAALDGNGVRVLARLTGFTQSVDVDANKKNLKKLLMNLLPEDYPGEFNQAIMDLGSGICTPKNPQCNMCPLNEFCLAFKENKQYILPLRSPKAAIPHYQVSAAVIFSEKKVLIDKRKSSGLLGGLWEFPGGKMEDGESLEGALHRELKEELDIKIQIIKKLGKYKHAYTHYRITVQTFLVKIIEGIPRAIESERLEWVPLEQLAEYPMGKVDRAISRDIQSQLS